MKEKFDAKKHVLVPEHIKLTKKQTKKILEEYKITKNELPRISVDDPALKDLKFEINDVVKIIRKSPTAGKSTYYRRVVK
ncbi:DNA-directed RNA polymerase subunit H [Candidatus Woesearchaeota archaeon]|nr:DNA-directed RNA polymerase subunit H [Candidatus Woesearchaeota archaeon]